MNKYISRLKSSDRGETFNPLTYPFLVATLAYGLGFTAFNSTAGVAQSSLFIAMGAFGHAVPYIWGAMALVTIIIGFLFLALRHPPVGKVSGLLGFMVWLFAAFCWIQTGGWLLVSAVGLPNIYFWWWQYFSLGKFRREDEQDRLTMLRYDLGEYDDKKNPKESKVDREDNRGKDRQSNQTYDRKDDGGDSSRALDSD